MKKLWPILLLSLLCHGFQDFSIQKASKVFDLIDKILLEQREKNDDDIRSVNVTENELNAYVAYRIMAEKEEILTELRFKLLDRNKLEVKAVVDLRGQNLPKYLKPEMTFYFGGILETKKGNVRLKLKDLFLENQRIQPMVLDLVIYIASKLQHTEPTGIEDWYELPFGIKDIKIQRGYATFYY